MRRLIMVTIAALSICSGEAAAGPFREAEQQVQAAYGDYRAALFRTNQNDRAASLQAIAGFGAKWAALVAVWRASPPPQYADDPALSDTLADIARINEEAKALAEAGKLAESHDVLEKIRERLAALRARNGVIVFSDHMNAYHEHMEKIAAGPYDGFSPAGLLALREDAAVLAYLADELRKNRPAAQAAALDEAMAPLLASVTSLRSALASNDIAAIKAAIKALKQPYARMFVRFG